MKMFKFLDFLRLYTALKSLKLDKKPAFSLGKRGKPSQKAHFFNTSNIKYFQKYSVYIAKYYTFRKPKNK